MKKRAKFFLFIGVALVMSGCGTINQVAEKELEKKYGVDFVVEEPSRISLMDAMCTMKAYPVDNPDMMFKVYTNALGYDGNDTYVQEKICYAMSDDIARGLDSYDGLVFVYSMINTEYTNIPKEDIDPQVFTKRHEYTGFTIEVLVTNRDDLDRLYDLLSKKFAEYNYLKAFVNVRVVDEQTLKEAALYSNQYVELQMGYKDIVADFKVSELDVERGKVSISKQEFISVLE